MSARDDAVAAATAAYGKGGYGHAHRMAKAIAAYEGALSAAGWVAVPREPTPGMTLAANKRVAVVTPDGTWALGRDEAARTWATMIAAALPAAPEARDDGR